MSLPDASSLPSLADRINHAMELRGLTQQQLADAAGTSQTTIQKLCSGKTRESKKLPDIARALGVPSEWLAMGVPFEQAEAGGVGTVLGSTGRKLPVVGAIAAGHWCEAKLQPAEVEEWIDSPGPVGPRAFVLKIEGVSMHNPAASISFAEGDRVVIDPDAPTTHGDFVAVRLDGSDHVTFKRLRQEQGEWFLEAINPAWEPRYIRASEQWLIVGKARWKVQPL